jgi:hypothetical protein
MLLVALTAAAIFGMAHDNALDATLAGAFRENTETSRPFPSLSA